MAYHATVALVLAASIRGRLHTAWEIAEAGAGAADEYEVRDIPMFGRIALVQCVLEGGAGTVSPEIGLASRWAPGTLAAVCENKVPAAFIRNVCSFPFAAPARRLFVRSRPSVPGASVKTRLVLVSGVF